MERTMDELVEWNRIRVAVLGEGAAALILALRFAQAGRAVTLVGRFNEIVRHRPLIVRSNDRNALRLLDELQLSDEITWVRRIQAFGGLGSRTQGTLDDGVSRVAHALRDRLIALGVIFRQTIESLAVDEIVASPIAVTDFETAVVLATSAYRARCADKIA